VNLHACSAHPHGSRRIQSALETATREEIMMVYAEVTPFALTMATDVCANYAIRKLLERGPQWCKMGFIGSFIGHVVSLSHHIYGSSVMQKVKLSCNIYFFPLL
jgi:pumilio RNA-binding family